MTQRLERVISRVSLAIAVTASLAAVYKAFAPVPTSLGAETRAVEALGDSAMLIGSASARQTVLLATDHQCPFCRQMRESLSTAMMRDSLRLNVRILPFPLTGLHPTAELSARALVCAARQGKQAAADSILFDLGAEVDALPSHELARKLGLGDSPDQFALCVQSVQVVEYVRNATDVVRRAGADATPTMWVNGRRITGLTSVDSLLVDGTRR
jgi:protein-disulfide isomerase